MMFITKYVTPLAIVCLLMTHTAKAQVNGCTDLVANNYNSLATVNNGSCTYNTANLSPTFLVNLPASQQENSGMIYWNSKLWSINDGGSPAEIHEWNLTGTVARTITVSNASNVDWEDIAQDDTYLYIGDFGNNASGNRTDLKIYRVLKTDVAANTSVTAEVINFSYADQTNFAAVPGNTTDWDCEAMIILNGKAYLFLKRWTSLGTAVYEVPLTPGTVQATRIATRTDPNWLVTGADVVPGKRSIVLTGYNGSNGTRYLYLLYDYSGTNFFSGNKRIVNLNGVRQTESIAFKDDVNIYLASERLVALGGLVVITQALESQDLTSLLGSYYLQLLPIENIDLRVSVGNLANRIMWDVVPAEELATGWVQRKDAQSTSYTNIHRFSEARGWYDDAYAGSAYYRIKAEDKDGRGSYSREYKISQAVRSASITRNGNIIYAPTGSSCIEVYGMNGNRLLKAIAKADVSTLPAGVYVALGLKANGEVMARSTFVR